MELLSVAINAATLTVLLILIALMNKWYRN